MENNFRNELKGTIAEAIAAKEKIAKLFRRYGQTGHEDALKHQLIFARNIMESIANAGYVHPQLYCDIIVDIFGKQLKPEGSEKYWNMWCSLLYHYYYHSLVEKRNYENSWTIFEMLVSIKNKFQCPEVAKYIVNIYCSQLFLQYCRKDRQIFADKSIAVLDALIEFFGQMLDKHHSVKFQYFDVVNSMLKWMLPNTGLERLNTFYKSLNEKKVKTLFVSIFKLYRSEKRACTALTDDELKIEIQTIFECLLLCLRFDLINKLQLKLTLELLRYCRNDVRFENAKALNKSLNCLYELIQILYVQHENGADFSQHASICFASLHTLYKEHSEMLKTQSWFSDLLVFLHFVFYNFWDPNLFAGFWKQIKTVSAYQQVFGVLSECTRHAAAITSSDTKMHSADCCGSVRKHVIVSMLKITLAVWVLYCQSEDIKLQETKEFNKCSAANDAIFKYLISIVNHAFRIIDNMTCIDSSSNHITMLLGRFKQAANGAGSVFQANTCIAICELFLKIKQKIPTTEWPLLVRRLLKMSNILLKDNANVIKDYHMCYIAWLLKQNMDIALLRYQISLFYNGNLEEQPVAAKTMETECLLNLYQQSSNAMRPKLTLSELKFFHWYDMQHLIKYHKENTILLESLLNASLTKYEYVLIARIGKMQCVKNVYEALTIKLHTVKTLKRLEHLTLAHACSLLLQKEQDCITERHFQVDSKDLAEDKLDQFLHREEFSTITIQNELKLVKLALEAYNGFKEFFNNYDKESITMNEAIIDWEAILDDISAVANYLQLSGYLNYSMPVWMLLFRCAQLVQEDFSAYRSLAFFCEHYKYLETETRFAKFNLENEINKYLQSITLDLENISGLQRRNQHAVFLVALQIAYYYARCSKYEHAQILLKCVMDKQPEIREQRQGVYDIIIATLDAIRFRLLWQHYDTKHNISSQSTAGNNTPLLDQCIVKEVEAILERFRSFICFSSLDNMAYMILLFQLTLEMAECCANRLTDNHLNIFLIAACRLTLQNSLALRTIQLMTVWMRLNLQMEFVDGAQMKLMLVECIIGAKNIKDALDESCAMQEFESKSIQMPNICANDDGDLITLHSVNSRMEAMRKLLPVQLSPIKSGKLEINPMSRNTDLKRYFKCGLDHNLPNNDILEWTLFAIGCLNARLYFLVEEYDQLTMFYERGFEWLMERKINFNKKYFQNIQLMAMMHFANYLRASKQYAKALEYSDYAYKICITQDLDIDVVYRVNFKLQLIACQREMKQPLNVSPCSHNKIKIQFDEKDSIHEKHKLATREHFLKQAMSSKNVTTVAKLITTKTKKLIVSTPTTATELKVQAAKQISSITASSSAAAIAIHATPAQMTHKKSKSPPIVAKTNAKTQLKFQICEDPIEIITSDEDNSNDELNMNIAIIIDSDTESNSKEDEEQQVEEAKKARKRTKKPETIKTAKNAKASSKTDDQQLPKINKHTDANNAVAKLLPTISSSSSVVPTKRHKSPSPSPSHNEITKETHTANDELITKMNKLQIERKKMKPTSSTLGVAAPSSQRKKSPAKDPKVFDIIILDDSPKIISSDKLIDPEILNAEMEQEENQKTPRSKITSRRILRHRKLKADEIKTQEEKSAAMAVRRRQKI